MEMEKRGGKKSVQFSDTTKLGGGERWGRHDFIGDCGGHGEKGGLVLPRVEGSNSIFLKLTGGWDSILRRGKGGTKARIKVKKDRKKVHPFPAKKGKKRTEV